MMRNSGALEEISETDWEAMYEKYQTPAYDARTNAEIRVVLNEMITSLGKSHFSLIPKESSVEFILGFEETEQDDAQDDAQDDEVSDQLVTSEGPGDGQIGIDVRLSDGAILVARVVDDSAASRAGVKSGWRVRKIRNFDLESQSERMKDIDPASMEGYQASGMAQALVSGAPGTAIPITFVDEDGQTHALRIACSPSQGEMVRFGNLPPMPVTTESMILDAATLDSMGFKAPDDIKIGVIRFNCWMVPIMEPIAKAVDEFRTQGVDAVILDLRGNPGGIGGLSMGVGGHFLEEPTNLGIMKNRFGEMNFNTNPQTITTSGELVTPLDMPLYIIIDSMSASTSEIFAGGMSEAGRATIVGRRSPGMALPAVAIDLPNGDVFYCATASFKLPSGKNVEGLGITPDIKIDLADNDATFKNDPDLSAVVRNHLAKIASPSKSNSGVQK
jgi:carboxyl-terminal processing protease